MRTLVEPCRFEETIKRSRFVTHAAPVHSQAEPLAFYESVADPRATHNCWAWRVNLLVRWNDDGEPGGTAGRPIASVIEGRSLDRVMVIVTRYFGGIKLGVGGLVRAYSGGAATCLDGASIINLESKVVCNLEAGFELTNSIHRVMDRFGAEKLDESWDDRGVRMRIEVSEKRLGALRKTLTQAGKGKIVLRVTRPES